MIIVKIIGGLGNQMFQYAYAKALQKKGYEAKIDTKSFEKYKIHGGLQLDKYYIDLDVASNEELKKYKVYGFIAKIKNKLKIKNKKVAKEKSLLFDEKFLNIKDDSYIEGYFQCEKYFKNIRSVLLKEFAIKQELSNYTKEIEQKIKSSQNSCSLHIRRGDFINDKNANIHGACSLDYYENAIKYLEEKEKNINYFIFSDDIEWVKENLKLEIATYIQSKEKRIPHEDIYLMSLCNHNITANSSFSWWGAWLNQNNEKIVMAPKRWFASDEFEKQSRDIVPSEWIKL